MSRLRSNQIRSLLEPHLPMHDWTKTDAATFHAFHTAWITHLSEALNKGLLPTGYYALPEQVDLSLRERKLTESQDYICYVGTDSVATKAFLSRSERSTCSGTRLGTSKPDVEDVGDFVVADTQPRTQGSLQRTLTVRHARGHHVVALLEVVSPANKDRRSHVDEFVEKVESAILQSVHVLVADLLPPGKHDPSGMHGAIWDCFDDEAYSVPPQQPLTLASYTADSQPIAYVEHLAVGEAMADMPLFLNPDRYINVPMAMTYDAAFQGLPSFLRDRLNQPN